MARRKRPVGKARHQSGVALLAILTLFSVVGLYLFVGQLNATQHRITRDMAAATTLVEAKQALIGDAVSRASVNEAGYLRLPDLGFSFGSPAEGYASGAFAGNGKDFSVVGMFPWKTLDTGPLRDDSGQCLWYAVSGRLKTVPKTDALNWDTLGQIDVINANGSFIAVNLAALLVAPGPALEAQSRTLADPAYLECGGNYDARNYLDAFDSAHAVAGQLNYFDGSTNRRVASSSGNKKFVLVDSDYFNDRFEFVTVDQIFDPLIRRRDFAAMIGILAPSDDPGGRLLDDPTFQAHLKTIVISGSKGTDRLDCSCKNPPACTPPARGDAFQEFCDNWKEMLFLTQLPTPSRILIDGVSSSFDCSRVLLFAGRKTAAQSRATSADKANPLNYLENANASSFGVPTASSSAFAGRSVFDWRNAAADLVRCLA
ncbi:hypothetical protein [Accumulibacter sp.]|uniref:hypothetical protein n=1 Tax=Accumulibacter sp. TaxID=2053492 RepID=UPI002620D323|nr:hypothetical protein [Accumulibacter sp.]